MYRTLFGPGPDQSSDHLTFDKAKSTTREAFKPIEEDLRRTNIALDRIDADLKSKSGQTMAQLREKLNASKTQ